MKHAMAKVCTSILYAVISTCNYQQRDTIRIILQMYRRRLKTFSSPSFKVSRMDGDYSLSQTKSFSIH